MNSPKSKELTINMIFVNPSAIKEILIRMVEIMNPEFLIIVWKQIRIKKEKINNKTSTRIRI